MYLHIQLLCIIDEATVNSHLPRKKLSIMKVSSFSMATVGVERGEFEVPGKCLPSRLITWFNDKYVGTQCLAHSQFSLSLTITVLRMYLLCSPTHMRADGLCAIIKLGTKAFRARYNGVCFRNKFDRRKWVVKEEKWINYRLLTIKERRIIVLSQGGQTAQWDSTGKVNIHNYSFMLPFKYLMFKRKISW